jgi:hypothetical protein
MSDAESDESQSERRQAVENLLKGGERVSKGRRRSDRNSDN